MKGKNENNYSKSENYTLHYTQHLIKHQYNQGCYFRAPREPVGVREDPDRAELQVREAREVSERAGRDSFRVTAVRGPTDYMYLHIC